MADMTPPPRDDGDPLIVPCAGCSRVIWAWSRYRLCPSCRAEHDGLVPLVAAPTGKVTVKRGKGPPP